jgi:5'-phosphate synthase pdxT subunit
VEEHVAAAKLALREEKLEGEVVWVKNAEQFDAVDGIIIPGGESTVIGWLVAFNRLLPRIRERVLGGMPALGTCAGLIALSKKAYDSVVGVTSQPLIGALDVTVERNTFGRQRESFEADLDIPLLGPEPFRGVFIRAPAVTEVGPGVEVLCRLGDKIVGVKQRNVIGTAFHPELSGDLRLHRYFLGLVSGRR